MRRQAFRRGGFDLTYDAIHLNNIGGLKYNPPYYFNHSKTVGTVDVRLYGRRES